LAGLLGLLASGCSWLPKVHVVSDPLSKEEHLSLAMTYEKDGELDIAEREYRAAFPLGAAYLGLGNVLYQKGEVDDAITFYRRAWQFDKIPAAANNLAWVLLMEGGSLEEAKEMATQAVSRAENEGLDQAVIDNFKGTLGQVEQAIKASGRRAEREGDG
jgi:tetratricopeptide (TPR) repeat protein